MDYMSEQHNDEFRTMSGKQKQKRLAFLLGLNLKAGTEVLPAFNGGTWTKLETAPNSFGDVQWIDSEGVLVSGNLMMLMDMR